MERGESAFFEGGAGFHREFSSWKRLFRIFGDFVDIDEALFLGSLMRQVYLHIEYLQ
jgi:hypothetical protein